MIKEQSDGESSSGQGPLDIVILGASFGGLSCAHHFLDHIIDRLGTSIATQPYRLIIVTPSTHIYWNIGAPRALVQHGLIKHDDTFVPIEPGFARHRGRDWTIIQAKALDWNPADRSVKIELLNIEAQNRFQNLFTKRSSNINVAATFLPSIQTLHYHALIITTGTSAHSDLLSLHGPHLDTAKSLDSFHRRVTAAKSIVICGGGTSGVEVAGQLATFLNHKHIGPISRKLPNPKSITLITGSDRCLPGVPNPKVGAIAERSLLKLGVEIRHNVRVTDVKEWFDQTGASRIELSDDTQLIADVYVPCTGVSPNTSFVPSYLKDDKGYIQTNHKTMRVDAAAGDRVYAIGDVASYSYNYIPDVYAAVPVVMHNLLNDLIAYELSVSNPYGGNDDYISQLVDQEYVQRKNDSQLCPISRWGGAGMLLGKVLPRVMVHVLKGHDYRVGKAKGVVVDGGNPYVMPMGGG
ncbi:hypothetical protein DOTSEDRAFT_88893 [Dothistroma septosporum NZE10]|uniref:FAD/NAD(P)-binding domain-containing protein n=1 Tax=Dothistroma septosporum (strain NZE10 / CBS 128990) TaxID=675120 RepID=M2Y3G1_DOTSN|nr:hypothetical protein DOTSEDRAFT_88893 [Dothistroma septosporum NZE10]